MKKVKDHYYKMAKDKNYLARSFFKLQEIDEKYRFLKKGMSILELGASPGSWVEYCLKKISPKGQIVALDLKPLQKTFPDNVYFLQEDVFNLNSAHFPDPKMKFDIILSDMAPNTSGNKGLNHQQSLELCREVIGLAHRFLKPDGSLVSKAFQGEDLQEFIIEDVKPVFQKYKLFKPKSSRKESVELFILGFAFKPKS